MFFIAAVDYVLEYGLDSFIPLVEFYGAVLAVEFELFL